MRAALVFAFSIVACARTPAAQSPSAGGSWIDADARATDLEEFCALVREHYVYAARSVGTWPRCEETFGAEARAAQTRAEFLRVLEEAVAALHDHHAGIGTHAPGSPHPVPTLADLWLESDNGAVVVTSVRPDSPASAAGLRPGTIVTHIDGVAVEMFSTDVALRVAAAGRRGQTSRVLTVEPGARDVQLSAVIPPERVGLVSQDRVGRIGILRIHNALGEPDLVAAFDEALDGLGDTDGLILDLRDTPSGGNTGVAEPILGRFVTEERAYQRLGWWITVGTARVPRAMQSVIVPRTDAPPYTKPMVVLVSRWTGSMGEGMAVGLDTLGRATVLGTPMAGLAGGVESFTLGASGISFQIPVGTIHTMDGTPRERWQPPMLVSPAESAADAVLTRGLETLTSTPQAEPAAE